MVGYIAKYNFNEAEIFAKLWTAGVYGGERTRYCPLLLKQFVLTQLILQVDVKMVYKRDLFQLWLGDVWIRYLTDIFSVGPTKIFWRVTKSCATVLLNDYNDPIVERHNENDPTVRISFVRFEDLQWIDGNVFRSFKGEEVTNSFSSSWAHSKLKHAACFTETRMEKPGM
uniref:Peptidylprolyl isomerase n=1 Tax=Angiostrongylus cantonensis TaxID=6313 RepID=A0A0K0CYZ5_ANGCA